MLVFNQKMCSISIWCTLVALCAVLSSTYGSSSVATNCAAGATCPISGSSTTTSTTSATTGKSTENIHNDSNNNKRIFLKEKRKLLTQCAQFLQITKKKNKNLKTCFCVNFCCFCTNCVLHFYHSQQKNCKPVSVSQLILINAS